MLGAFATAPDALTAIKDGVEERLTTSRYFAHELSAHSRAERADDNCAV
jgi:hypothetical protein